MTPVNVILMETEGPGFDSQERHSSLRGFALIAQLVERGAYIRRYAYRTETETPRSWVQAPLGASFFCDIHKKKMFFYFF